MGAEDGKLLADAIKAHPNYTQLAMNMFDGKPDVDMSNKGLDAGDAFIIAVALEKNDQVTGLDASSNSLGIEGGKALAASIAETRTITSVSYQKYAFSSTYTDSSCPFPLSLFSLCTWGKQVDASGNNLGPESGKAIAEALKINQTLCTIVLSGKNKDKNITIHADQLRQNTVDTLDYSGQGLHVDGGTFIIAELLKENTSVTKVSN
jgi:hypothetical protein